jgi:membrane protease YdiL (CAAX protease family)
VNPTLRDIVIKLLITLVVIALPLTIARLRGFNVRDFAGLHKPPARLFAIILGTWVAWMAMTELLLHVLQVDAPNSWPPSPLIVVVLRVLAIGILGPIGEELIFRGVLYGRLSPRLGVTATIVLLAASWSLIHIRYDWTTIAFICADGLILGYARYKTGSVITPMAMHIIGNLFSVWQSLNP